MSNKEYILAPSILSADFTHLLEDIEQTRKAGAQYVHLDVMDGQFVPNLSFGQTVIKSPRPAIDLVFDAHLMVITPENIVEDVAASGADIITFHYEATEHVQDTIDKIRQCGCKVGISVKPKTPIDVLDPYLDQIDMILIMTVEPGKGGQSYMDDMTQKIVACKKRIGERAIDIEVDGGINLNTIKIAKNAGANVFVAGSAVYNGNIYQNTAQFMKAMEE